MMIRLVIVVLNNFQLSIRVSFFILYMEEDEANNCSACGGILVCGNCKW